MHLFQQGMSEMLSKSILIMAGGTGGHVYPALAVADYLRGQGMQLFWLGTKAGLESQIVPQNNIQFFTINISGLRGKNWISWLVSPLTLTWAFIQSFRVMLIVRPRVVIGMGGFVSGPGGIAAWLLRIPLFIHEQNSIAGLTNRLLSPFANTIMQSFPDVMQGSRVVTTGNPVRRDILLKTLSPIERLEGRENSPLRLLVLGGSLGAKVLNEMLPRVMRGLSQDIKVNIWHQTGRAHYESTISLYQQHDINLGKVVPYIDDMAEAYSWSDIVLCRAGALTISEISIMGVASILVPYPYAADNHQMTNAKYLSDGGAAVLIPQSEVEDFKIVRLITNFYKNRSLLVKMSTLVQGHALPNATQDIGDICLEALYA